MGTGASRETSHVGLSAGLDEVGMGCLAGPLCIAVTAFHPEADCIPGVSDSKKLSFKKRMGLVPAIMERAVYFGVGWAHPTVIDEHGLSEAWRRAAFDALEGAPSILSLEIDGTRKIPGYSGIQNTYIKGDLHNWRIGAASILAKCMRDLEMIGMSKHYPEYKWEKNMGYGSTDHIKALLELGPTHYHRGRYLRKIYKLYQSVIPIGNKAWQRWEERWLSSDPES